MPAPLAAARAVIFDLDGTLVDSLGDIATHLNDALVDAGLPARGLEEIRAHVGHGARQLVAGVVAAAGAAGAEDDVLARFRARYRARPVVATRVYPGLAATLDAIAPGRVFAVLSNKPHDVTIAVAAALLARWPFRVVVGQRAGVAMKPDPAALHAIARELATPLAACAMIGDSEVDLATARAAAVPGVAVTWGLRPRADLVAARPDHLVDAPAALAALFA